MKLKVMVVDHKAPVRALLRCILEAEGHRVVAEAATGVEAVEKYRQFLPDLTTMEVLMPLKSGIEALAEIRELDRDARVVICTVMWQEALREEAKKAGALDYIHEPIDPGRMRAVLRNLPRH